MTQQPTPSPRPMTGKAWSLMTLLALIWAGSFPANRAALTEVGVLTTVAIRATGGALCLWAYVLWRRLPLPADPRRWGALAMMGLLNNVIPFSLIVWGQAHIPSGLASILNAATAIFTVLLAALVFADERLTPARAAGVAAGFAGVVTIVGPGVLTSLDLSSRGQIAVLAATLSYALAAIFARRFLKDLPAEVSAAGMLTGAAAIMIPLALTQEGLPSQPYSTGAVAALAYLAVMASAIAYFLYYAVLRLAGAGSLSLVTLMIPPFAVVLGRVLFAERLTLAAYAGFGLIAFGLLLIDGRLAAGRKSG